KDMEKFKCKNCNKEMENEIFMLNMWVCPYCNYHHSINARDRLQITADENSFIELGKNINSIDFLNFYDTRAYSARLKETKLKTGMDEAIMVGEAKIEGIDVAIGIMDFRFMGGSMGSVVGEKIKILSDHSIEKKIPLIIFCASGGARMQEGVISLMQMAKTVSCINRVKENIIPYISVITNPTSGGVSASFATLADIIIAEPDSLFCFAGPRVIKQTIKKNPPPDFGSAERNLKNGQIDMIVNRSELKKKLANILELFR
ncbi:MAG: acetyl-CoA carboxylase, carboxyltransferase subunit beta, partial [Actinomycetota bacterium]|nr:acetyl-CoA carboxylase, carboxyltransferase subunit beta [Actinomycetota bacterium]